ncbi:NADPH-dependent F420 reductase (plasmid) [Agrobacterium sp. rho-13.3]|uniref:NADPH-dependent F420 reductase n=1 Tax=Agrobacterium sp. rho-13.3 TaxID=3072980 RepID=UPI002A0F7DD8|nr:NAD(P)-binding domain-containing protein [Agrobacterium sp. rho-13.3]MDX8312048.1 NAD(P)-binding domain-containing protein [Agrobacterium sp. rho-13.3]
MKIGIIGSGHVGRGVAALALSAGHDVMISNSRTPRSLFTTVGLLQLQTRNGGSVAAGTAAEAASFGEIVLVAVPLYALNDIPVSPMTGKIVIDANNYYPDRDGQIPALDRGDTTAGELLAHRLPQSRIVKAFSAIPAFDLDKGLPSGTLNRRAQPIAGDDIEAKAVVAKLLDQFGFDAVDAGPLKEGRLFQPDTPAYCIPLNTKQLQETLGIA